MKETLKEKDNRKSDEEDFKKRAEQDDQEDEYGQDHKFNPKREDE